MAFCEDCGSPLTPGDMFCGNCGAKVAVAEAVPPKASVPVAETGVIYTNLPLLASKLGMSTNSVSAILSTFMIEASRRGVGYSLHDVSGQISDAGTPEKHVEVIRKIVTKDHPKYLFIIGSYDVVPPITWENEACDSEKDCDVTSDLAFSTLDTNSPFNGQTYNFKDYLKVGRLPNVSLETYFANLKEGCGNVSDVKTYGLSALVWQDETRDIYSNIVTHGTKVLTSPNVTKDNVPGTIPADTNLLLFNLHGSRQTKFWYGQEDSSYPEAIAPESLRAIKHPYFLAVEACYGAFYEGRTPETSVLLNALNGKCITFLGSSRIAFGTPRPVGSCADVICGEFLKRLKAGESAGDALNNARAALMQNDDPEIRKTLAEFALYGDPSARMTGTPKAAKALFSGIGGGAADSSKSFAGGINISMPDVHRAVRQEIISVDERIARTVEEFIRNQYKDMADVKPKYYRLSGKTDMKALFAKTTGIGPKIVNVTFSASGQIRTVIESK